MTKSAKSRHTLKLNQFGEFMGRARMQTFLVLLAVLTLGLAPSQNIRSEEVSVTDQGASLEREAGKVDCKPELKLCVYLSPNLTARDLISRIMPVMFPDMPLDPREGFVQRETLKRLIFWFNDETLRQRFSSLLPHLDALEDFVPNTMVNVTTEIYAVTDEALTSIFGSLGLSNNGASTDPAAAGLNLSFGIGSYSLSVALSGQRIYNRVSRITTVQQVIPNFSSLSYSNLTQIFVSPTAGVSKEQEAGLKLGGTVSVNRNDSNQVLVKDFTLSYGVEVPQSIANGPRVAVLSINNPELYLVHGVSSVVVSTNTFELRRNMALGLPLSVDSGKSSAKLMIVMRAQAYSFQEFVAHNRELRLLESKANFTKEEIQAMPNDEVPLKVMAQSLQTFSKLGLSGDRLLFVKFDKQFARPDNIKKNVEVTITTKGFKQKEVRTLESLMLTGIKLDDLPVAQLQAHIVKLKVTVKPFGKKTLFPAKKNVFYNPATNEFLK